MTDELPHHDEASEWFLLACLIHKPQLIRGIRSNLFYIPECVRVLLKMQAFMLEGRQSLTDPATFLHDLGRALEPHYHEPLGRAMDQLPSPENWPYWLEILVANWKARRLLAMTPKLSDASRELRSGNTVPVEKLRQELHEIETGSDGASVGRSIASLMNPVIDELERAHKSGGALIGIPTSLSNLDRATNGLQKGRFYIFAGRPGEGKSSLCMTLAYGASCAGKHVLYFSLEMPAEELAGRLLSSISRVVLGKFSRATASENDFSAVGRAALLLNKTTINVVDSVSNLQDIIHHAGVEASRGKADLVIVDYLQRVRIPNFKGNRNELVTEISNAMKDLAMSAAVPVVCAAQLNRSVTKDDREPHLADLRDSGALEQDADFVGLLHASGPADTKMLVAKNRSGETGTINFTFRREITRFEFPL